MSESELIAKMIWEQYQRAQDAETMQRAWANDARDVESGLKERIAELEGELNILKHRHAGELERTAGMVRQVTELQNELSALKASSHVQWTKNAVAVHYINALQDIIRLTTEVERNPNGYKDAVKQIAEVAIKASGL